MKNLRSGITYDGTSIGGSSPISTKNRELDIEYDRKTPNKELKLDE